ncbi:epoxide hydrolase family protein [Rhizobium lentis]|uniref:epoxide hydrolase family protein n=1 Tax=Rhizobium lentis TaxID=1138194 RepID=UPI001C83F023|nr:alpha/beta fold hydrolase [Rhizobium lentis]MBX4974985.1 alpha/beta fold hydrolase [Rhizobium lentis]MBX4989782.1 alpha/beta fold hydrolase [Rhizobium lentis]MBX5008283.1 alpha/beta fold hydrolase [Rhizobium lentis]MBX5026945.1 alpha/beta fold hydrolase [Rhizobium lentis]
MPTQSVTRRALLATAAVAGAMSLLPVAPAIGGSYDKQIRPFKYKAKQADLDDLRRRIKATRFPDREVVDDNSQGVQSATIEKLASFWAKEYDWRKVEAKLNTLPQFTTEIDGVEIHFIHVKSKHEGALPIIVTHGWPGSVIEQMKIIEPLTDPVSAGGSASDAFDVVIPSIPGYGFSGKPTERGWDPVRIARAWIELMQRLGYDKYVAQGGDWGDAVTEQMALIAPPGLLGIHVNMPATIPEDVAATLQPGGKKPDGLSADESKAYDQLADFYAHGLGYAIEMANRPQTLVGIADSPVGLAAWMIDHDIRSYELIARVFDGRTEGLSREDILDNVTLYWLTNTAVSSARLYWENKLAFFQPKNVKIPVAVSVFPDEIYAAPRSWTEKAYPNLIHFNKLEKGGHFAAWEQTKVFCEELRAGFRTLRAL